ncbi:glycosyltransferase family 2 protein [Pararhizobium mangrovi]|uniref:Glycosyltransferase family 2 protein n=1 Tax=Pararhizobium mangrovi TaxID=2590452 RepID=A0A506U3T4_9HYPH|nr:glycosyltransferase family 2 protein [Pararhizobium mangrovi]TPW29002.1 glycosyltransferase family 2 protein [Pararhizobium mangrovi]
MSETGTSKVSVLVPAFNEEANVRRAYEAIADVFANLTGYEYEIIFTDNHSTDRTFAILREIAQTDPRVRVIRFSRNVGYQRSLLAAYKAATGECSIQIDCDLQDPPSLIPAMLDRWREGHEVVYGIRRGLTDGRLTQIARRLFYRLIRFISTDDLPVNVGEFRLVDRKILDILQQVSDTSPYLRGLISAMGFSQVGFEYDRQARIAGISKFPLKAMVSLAVDGLLNHSLIPLRLASLASFLVGTCTLVLFAGYFVGKLFFGQDWPAGFATTTVLILLSIMLNAMFLGIIGEYVGRIFMQSKGWPVTIIEKALNDDIRLVHPTPAKRETS